LPDTDTSTIDRRGNGRADTQQLARLPKDKSKIASMIDEKLIAAADTLDQFSNGVGAMPSSLSAFANPVRNTLGRAGDRLRRTDGDELIEQARDFIVKRPGAFVIATALVAAAAAEALVIAARNDAGPKKPGPKKAGTSHA
jgi:hypothetical protein